MKTDLPAKRRIAVCSAKQKNISFCLTDLTGKQKKPKIALRPYRPAIVQSFTKPYGQ